MQILLLTFGNVIKSNKMHRAILFLTFLLVFNTENAVNGFRLNVTNNKNLELTRFWTSTGFSPGSGVKDTANVLASR